MKFKNLFSDRVERYSIGIEEGSGVYYLSIPVANRMVNYDEYYKISKGDCDIFISKPELAVSFAKKCKDREMDFLLIITPGEDRGVAS